MSDFEVAHYQGLLSGGLIWAILLGAIVIGAAARAFFARPRTIPAVAVPVQRSAWVGPVLITLGVIAFFLVAPFVVYGQGPAPSARGVVMVLAGQVGYAASFLLLGLVATGIGRILGFRDRSTVSFALGTGAGMALSALAAASNHHPWLLAAP